MNRRIATIGTLGFVAGTLAISSNAHAWLGGFEPADGYQPFLNHVNVYNAGHYGPNSGYGGGPTSITPNTDFWRAIAGGFGSSYGTGHQFLDRSWVNNGVGSRNDLALQLTTGHQGWTGPALNYQYDVDAPDLGGVSPSSTGGTKVNFSFWWKGHLQGADGLGFVPEGYLGHTVQMRDSGGNIGFQVGMTQRVTGDKVTFWNGSTMFESTLAAPASKYDRWDITLDLANNTVSADYFQFFGSVLTSVVTNQPMMNVMSDFTTLDFKTSPGITNEKGHGLCIDDVHMSVVPEPTTIAALGLGAAALVMRRPRRA